MRRLTACCIAVLCLPLVGCYEEPVSEHVHLWLTGSGLTVVTVTQDVAEPDWAQDNTTLSDRLESSREEINSGLDRWSQRFNLIDKAAERLSIERVHDGLRQSIHTAVTLSFDDVMPMLEADGLTGGVVSAGGEAELSLYPTGGSRATSLQRQNAERLLSGWSSQVADYFKALIELYRYLETRPDRSLPCLAHIFDDHEGHGETGPLTDPEGELVSAVKSSMEEVADALIVPPDQAYSLNSLTRLVYDPFPARLTVVVRGEVRESEGFVETGDLFERQPVDAWNALRSLAGRWASPDLVTLAVAPVPEEELPEIDIEQLASQPRRYGSPPAAFEVESSLMIGLAPEELLRIRWRPVRSSPRESADDEPNWTALMTAAEASIPD
jgi:hypothetical protein